MDSRADEPASGLAARSTTGLGILYIIAGTFLPTLQDGITKWPTFNFNADEIMFYRGLRMFPASAVVFVSPVLLTAVSLWLLGESVGWPRWGRWTLALSVSW